MLAQVGRNGVDGAERSELGAGHLNFAGAVEVVHDVKCVGDGTPDRQQAVALQNHGDMIPQRALNTFAFVEVKRHALIRVIADALIKLGADLVKL